MPSRPIYDKKAIWSWYFYDFANSPFTTLVITFIYAPFFTQAIASDEIRGTTLWSRGVTVTALTVAFLSPLMGAMADRGGFRKAFLLASTVISILGTAALYQVLPGQVFLALAFVVVANIAFEMGLVFYNAFLPDIAPPGQIGRISGYGWGLGYAGALAALFVVQSTLDLETGEGVRASNLIVALWFLVFSIPIFVWVREDKSRVSRGGKIVAESYRQLKETFSEIQKYRQIIRFLVARLFYNDGLVTIFAFGGIYAAGTFDFSYTEIVTFALVLNITAGLGAAAMGRLDDKLGGKKTIRITLWALLVASLLAVLAPNRAVFWTAAVLVGIFSGPNQAASRSLMARFVPPEKENEFFGFFAFSGKATAFMGPFLLGTLTSLFAFQDSFNPQRAGVAVVVFFFAVGLVLLGRVDEEEGRKARP